MPVTIKEDGGMNVNSGSNNVNVNMNTTGNVRTDAPVQRVPQISEMLQKYSVQGGWSGEASKYLEDIRSYLEDPSFKVEAKMGYLSDGSVAFVTAKHGVVIVGEDGPTNLSSLVNDGKFFTASRAFHTEYLNIELVNIVTINRFMYNRASQMAGYIKQCLVSQRDEDISQFNVENFSSQQMIQIDSDLANVKHLFEQLSTNAVFSGDFGFIANLVDKSPNRNAPPVDPKPIFAVSGYVEFVNNDHCQIPAAPGTFTPLVHITDIVSVLTTPRLLGLVLPVAGHILIDKGLWKHPFSVFGSKTDINIGNLITDKTTGVPMDVKDETGFRQMFHEKEGYITKPILYIDVRSGAAGIPYINRMSTAADQNYLIKMICGFLNIAPPLATLGMNFVKEIVGVIETSKSGRFSNLQDTRDFTYLYAMARLKKWNEKLEGLLIRADNDPAVRFNLIREINGGEITPTYCSNTVILDGQFMAHIAQALSQKINIEDNLATNISGINLSQLAANAYASGNFFANQRTHQGINTYQW